MVLDKIPVSMTSEILECVIRAALCGYNTSLSVSADWTPAIANAVLKFIIATKIAYRKFIPILSVGKK